MKVALIGNAPFENRGCEAIIRGTVEVLDATLGDSISYITGSLGDKREIASQQEAETNRRIEHAHIKCYGRLSFQYVGDQIAKRTGLLPRFEMFRIPSEVYEAEVALQVGGDNYTLDYGKPNQFIEIDNSLLARGKKLVLWGATVGPFSEDREYERKIKAHLAKFLRIYVRERRSEDYLNGLGLGNVQRTADPAFLMKPSYARLPVLPNGFIGVNLSPLTAVRATRGDIQQWAEICAKAVKAIVKNTSREILLVPHVFSAHDWNDDRTFLELVKAKAGPNMGITVLPDSPNAVELKAIISKSYVFIGARTHSTIAALSSCVPTISLAYSTKAWGINEDIFGHSDYCLDVKELGEQGLLAERVDNLIKRHSDIVMYLKDRNIKIWENALAAGRDLRCVLDSNQ